MHIVASGSFTWGFTFNGPFPNSKEALDWADSNLDRARNPWEIIVLEDADGYVDDSDSVGSWILVVGDACNGHSAVGPFDSPESALKWEHEEDADSEGFSYIPTHLSPID